MHTARRRLLYAVLPSPPRCVDVAISCEACVQVCRKQLLDFARRALGEAELWFLRGVLWSGAPRLQLPLSAIVGAWVSRKRFLHLPRSNHTLGLIFCILYVEAEYCLCVNRGRSCLEVCTADVIRKFQI